MPPKRQDRESEFSRSVTNHLKKIPKSWWLRVELDYVRGIPDRIGVVNGTFVALETKRSKSEAEKGSRALIQRRVLKKIIDAGGYGSFIYPENAEQIYAELRELL